MDNVRKFPRTLATVVAVLAAVSALALAPGASADPAPPTLNALHAFVGDPLFGLDTPEGTLFGIKPDEQSAMGSAKKVWLLDIAAHALAQGKVHLDDQVTITKFEAGIGGSTMADVNGTPLEAGEVVTFDDLIRGMMYPSGNNATYAVARHVAQGYFGPAADWKPAVTLMNQHAAALGQSDTHLDFTPYHDDDLTTARELSEEFQHGLQVPYFAAVVGFSGTTWNASTQGPNGPKTYAMGWGRAYPGWEGEKGGSSVPCNGPNQGCGVVAATRVGRRVVVSAMQQGGNDLNNMLDYGFASIFHPDLRATSFATSDVSRHNLDCLPDGRAVGAVIRKSGQASLSLWQPNVDGSSITMLQEVSPPVLAAPPQQSMDVAVTHLSSTDFVMATRRGASVELSRWGINPRGGALTLLASGIEVGSATSIGLQQVYGDTFLTAMITPGGKLVVKSWRLQGSGLANLDTFTDMGANYKEVALTGPLTTDVFNGHRAVTVALGDWFMAAVSWNVDQVDGSITPSTSQIEGTSGAEGVTVAPFSVRSMFDGELSPVYYATAFRGSDGNLAMRYLRIAPNGTPQRVGGTNANIPVKEVRLAALGTEGVMSAVRDPSGYHQLIAWEARRGADDDISPSFVAQRWTPGGAASVSLCRLPSTHAEGDFLTATEELNGLFRLRAYRSGDRPY